MAGSGKIENLSIRHFERLAGCHSERIPIVILECGPNCHSERSEESRWPRGEILRSPSLPQDDTNPVLAASLTRLGGVRKLNGDPSCGFLPSYTTYLMLQLGRA